jgi:hypothetical protein
MKKVVHFIIALCILGMILFMFLILANIVQWTVYGGSFFSPQIFHWQFAVRLLGFAFSIILASMLFWLSGMFVFGKFLKTLNASMNDVASLKQFEKDVNGFTSKQPKKEAGSGVRADR